MSGHKGEETPLVKENTYQLKETIETEHLKSGKFNCGHIFNFHRRNYNNSK